MADGNCENFVPYWIEAVLEPGRLQKLNLRSTGQVVVGFETQRRTWSRKTVTKGSVQSPRLMLKKVLSVSGRSRAAIT